MKTRCEQRPLVAGALSLVVPGLGQIYNGQLIKGVAVFFTAFLVIPYIYGVIDAYLSARRRQQLPWHPTPRALQAAPAAGSWKARSRNFEHDLVAAAQARGGTLSITEGVLATGRSFEDVEKKLDEMARAGFVDIDNRPDSGVMVYRFTELAA